MACARITPTPEHEQYGRLGQFDPTVANPNAGGRLGGYRYASTCNCQFYKSAYPYGIGPRIGAAYQIAPKTVLRGGWGVNYQFIANPAGGLVSCQRDLPAFRHQPLRQHLDARRHCAAELAGNQPDYLSGAGHGRRDRADANRARRQTRTGRRASINSASASSGKLRGILWWRHLMLRIARSGSLVA